MATNMPPFVFQSLQKSDKKLAYKNERKEQKPTGDTGARNLRRERKKASPNG
jgi:hypothetical protein